jgi:hypothetical protein
MPAPSFLQYASTAQIMRTAQPVAKPDAAKSGGAEEEGFFGKAFHEFLDIVNPLQHLPVIGTLYRAITGDTQDTVSKIAGDTLYGGLWGAVSAVADSAFQAVTGKDFGSTVLAFAEDTLGFGHHDAPVALAANTAPAAAPQTDPAGVAAFSGALAARGVDGALATRALYAYRRSQGLIADPLAN